LSVLIVSRLAFTVCLVVWTIFGVINTLPKKTLDLNSMQFGLLTAMPVLTGSLARVPLGMWTDKFGGRIVMCVLAMACVAPIWMIGHATEYWQFLVLGLFIGAAGGVGGFVFPVMFGALMGLTGIRSFAFMLMYGVVLVSLIRMFWTEVRGAELMGSKARAFRLRGWPHLINQGNS
jgi:nitrate/nitrite transporter NarK